jgi:hypothetical protein
MNLYLSKTDAAWQQQRADKAGREYSIDLPGNLRIIRLTKLAQARHSHQVVQKSLCCSVASGKLNQTLSLEPINSRQALLNCAAA